MLKKKIIVLLFALALVLLPMSVNASTVNGYEITSYDVHITVNEDNTYRITENISIFCDVPKHGIIRNIPTICTIKRADGTNATVRAVISDIMINAPYTSSIDSGNRALKIGDADVTFTGEKFYTISYLYDMGRDSGVDYDEFYFNLIGDQWDTNISGVTFTITMPEDFNENKVAVCYGRYGEELTDGINYSVEGRTISGSYDGTLSPYEAMTVRTELPEGYFTTPPVRKGVVIFAILPLLFVLASFLFWLQNGRDKRVVAPVEFYPPKELNSAELGFLYKGKAETKDAMSLLIFLADRGYLKISEIETPVIFGLKTKSFSIEKLREYDGDNAVEQIFFNGLFAAAQTTVTEQELKNEFYKTLNNITSNLNGKQNKNKYYEKYPAGKVTAIVFMIIATFLLITIKPMLNYGGAEMALMAIIFPGIGFSMLLASLFCMKNGSAKAFGIIWGFFFGGVPWATMVLPGLIVYPEYLMIYLLGLVCIALMMIFIRLMPKKTAIGAELYDRIIGFRRFLKYAEKDKLEELVVENPTYFYDILPYTYVLGLSNKWIKKFETIAINNAEWYDGSSGSSGALAMSGFMASTMRSAERSMMSSPSSSGSGGGGGGGGFSGGGGGGGGGSSW